MGFRNRIVRISQLVADTITGAVVQTAATGNRWVMSGSARSTILGYTGFANETQPAVLQVLGHLVSNILTLGISAPQSTGVARLAHLDLTSDPGTGKASAVLGADTITLDGATTATGLVDMSAAGAKFPEDAALAAIATSINLRVYGGWVWLWIDGAFATTSGVVATLAVAGTIPATLRPPGTVRGGAYFSGFAGLWWAAADGSIQALQQSGAARASVSGFLIWPAF